jgi:uncharacterized protein (TIGR02186 family)
MIRRLRLRWILLALVFFGAPVQAAPVVADISTYRVAIDAGFTGIRLFIFGARNESGDVVVVIRGPEHNFVVRKKERIGGIWVNRRQLSFENVPEFYALAAVRPLAALEAEPLLRNLGIGAQALLTSPSDIHDKARFPEFSHAFFNAERLRRLYNESLAVTFMGETLFKTVIPLPDNIPRGEYTAEIYLISDGELAGMQAMPIRVEKTGFDAAVYEFAHTLPLLYGIVAVLMAVGAGWLAGRIFGKT